MKERVCACACGGGGASSLSESTTVKVSVPWWSRSAFAGGQQLPAFQQLVSRPSHKLVVRGLGNVERKGRKKKIKIYNTGQRGEVEAWKVRKCAFLSRTPTHKHLSKQRHISEMKTHICIFSLTTPSWKRYWHGRRSMIYSVIYSFGSIKGKK